MIAKALPHTVSSIKMPGEHAMLTDQLLCPQQFILAPGHCHMGISPYGIGEVRIVLGGTYFVAGWALSQLNGDTLAKKLENFTKADQHQAIKTSVNFYARHEQVASLLYIPPGYVCAIWHDIANMADGPGIGIRFGFMRNQASYVKTVRASLDLAMQASLEYKEKYAAWASVLQNHIAPFTPEASAA